MKNVKKILYIASIIVFLTLIVSCQCDDNLTKPSESPNIENQRFRVPNNLSDMEVIGRVVASDPDTSSLTYRIVSNDNNNLFDIVGSSGDLSLANGESFDFAVTNLHFLTVEVSDGEFFPSAIITIDVGIIPIITNQNFTFREDITNEIIASIMASDPDSLSLIYSIVNNNLFEIASNNGDLSLAGGTPFNLEVMANRHTLTIEVSDGEFSSLATIIINVIEVPIITNQSFTVREDIMDSNIIGIVMASEPDTSLLTYRILSNDNDLFEIDSDSGELSLDNGLSLDFETTNRHFLAVEATDGEFSNSATVIINVQDFFNLSNTYNVMNGASLALEDPASTTTAEVGGSNYLFVTGTSQDGLNSGVSVFAIENGGLLNNVHNVFDDTNSAFRGAISVTTAEVGGSNYLFVAGQSDNGVSVFAIENGGILNNVHNVFDDADLALNGAFSVTTAEVGGSNYLFVAGQLDNGVSVFAIENGGLLNNVHNVFDDTNSAFRKPFSVTTAEVEGSVYLFVAVRQDNGVSVFSVENGGILSNVHNVFDDANLELSGAFSVTTAEVRGFFYLFVSGFDDHGVSVFVIENGGLLRNVDNVFDNTNLAISGPTSVTTVEEGGSVYLFVTGFYEGGMSVFAIENGGLLRNVDNIKDGARFSLSGSSSMTTTEVGGSVYLFVAGFKNHELNVFRIDN